MPDGRDRGFTLIEVVVAMGITAVLVGLVVSGLVGLARDRSSREAVIEVQGEARFALGVLEQDVRSASLGAGTGIVTAAAGTVPMVQVYENVSGGFLDAKPGSDALLVVRALSSLRAAAVGDTFGGTTLTVTATSNPATGGSSFRVGDAVLFGEYGNAGWSRITAVRTDVGQLTLDSQIVRMGGLGAEEKLPSGSMVRPARARLYYLNANDELVQIELTSPVPPAVDGGWAGRQVLAIGVENLQLGVQLDPNFDASGCTVATPTEASASLAAASARLSTACAPHLRTVSVGMVVHGRRPLRDIPADQGIALQVVGAADAAQQLTPAGANAGDVYVRRAYQLEMAVRNTSLGAL